MAHHAIEVRVLNALIQLDLDAIEAYQAALSCIRNPHYRAGLQRFSNDHVRHTQELSAIVEKLGATPPRGPSGLRALTTGPVLLADFVGDTAILIAMRVNEEITHRAYQLSSVFRLRKSTRTALKSNRADEQRHKLWIGEQVMGHTPEVLIPVSKRPSKRRAPTSSKRARRIAHRRKATV